MAFRLSEDRIWYWYEWIEKFHESDMKPSKFCKKHNLKYTEFMNRYNRMIYKSRSDPELHARLAEVARKYSQSNLSAKEFASDPLNDISQITLGQIVTHLNYVARIDKIKKKRGFKMKFIELPQLTPSLQVIEAEKIAPPLKKRNDIELIISSGIKVVVSPEVESQILIQIIELLKDL